MATEGIEGLYIETHDYRAAAEFWAALGFSKRFETDHGSGQWEHPAGGPYVFLNQRHQGDLELHPILRVSDPATVGRSLEVVQPFTPQHWGVLEAQLRDPDGRTVRLQAQSNEAQSNENGAPPG